MRFWTVACNMASKKYSNGLMKRLVHSGHLALTLISLSSGRGDPDTTREVKELLLGAGFTTDTIVAEAFVQNIEEVQRLEAMMTNLERRRKNVLEELDR